MHAEMPHVDFELVLRLQATSYFDLLETSLDRVFFEVQFNEEHFRWSDELSDTTQTSNRAFEELDRFHSSFISWSSFQQEVQMMVGDIHCFL